MSSSTTTSATVVTSSTGSSYIASTASGLDTASLINAAVAQKTARADTIDAKVTANEAKIDAYTQLQSLVSAVATAIQPLAEPTYSALGTGNAFDNKQTSISTSDGSSASNLLAVSADSTASSGTYTVTVEQLATSMKVTADASSASTALGLAGAVTLGESGGSSAQVTITADMTLTDVVNAINAASNTSGVNAVLIKASDNSYRLVLSSADTNQTITYSQDSGDDVLQGLGLTDSSGQFVNVAQQAQPAKITLDGLEVTRDTNELDDVIPGVGLSLYGLSSSGASVTLTIQPDYDGVKTALTNFITAYNNLRDYVNTQQTVGSDGTVSSDAVLFADSILRSLTQSLSSLLNTMNSTTDRDVTTLGDLGVTFADDNTLELSDENKLDSAILSHIDDLQGFFETSFQSSDPTLRLLRNDAISSLSFDLSVTTDDTGAVTDVLADGQSGMFTVSNGRLIGATGTKYEGLTFIYVAGSTQTIHIDLNQGFANTIGALLDKYADTSSGVIQQQIESLTDIDTNLTSQSNDIRSAAETYRQQLVDKYAAMENEVSAAQLIQKQIQAILGASNSDDD